MGISQIPNAANLPLSSPFNLSAKRCRLSLLPTRTRSLRQTRNFRLRLWSIWDDSTHERQSRHQHRMTKERYMDTLIKQTPWNAYVSVSRSRTGLKGLLCSTLRAQNGMVAKRWCIDDNGNIKGGYLRRYQKDAKADGQSEHDYDRGYRNRNSTVLNVDSDILRGIWSSSLEGTTKPIVSHSDASGRNKPGSPSSYYEVSSEIDPITNRRVVKNPTNRSDASVMQTPKSSAKTFKGYRSQFQKSGSQIQLQPPSTDSRHVLDKSQQYDGTVNTVAHENRDLSKSSSMDPDPVEDGLKEYDAIAAKKPLDCSPTEETHPTLVREPEPGRSEDREDYGTHLHPIEEAIEEYETKDEHPAITQQMIDHHSEARRNEAVIAEKRSLGTASECLTGDQSSSSAEADHLLETLKEYQEDTSHHEVEATESDSIVQEGLEAFDFKANYEPKHLVDLPVEATKYPGRADADSLTMTEENGSSRSFSHRQRRDRQDLEKDFVQPSLLSAVEEAAALEKIRSSPKLIQDLQIEASELQNYVAHARGRINAKLADVDAEWLACGSKPRPAMTGNFVRDFPEEFNESWSKERDDASGLLPKSIPGRNSPNSTDRHEAARLSGARPDEIVNGQIGTNRLETSLDRIFPEKVSVKLQNDATLTLDAHSSPGRGTGRVESDKKLNREVRNIYEDTYGIIDCKHRQLGEHDTEISTKSNQATVATDPQESTLYKILAYDPTMQSINIAETTSIVPDSAAPLTPAEVLLRLSNPSKFFPHFQSLQVQGYEIVSGSGDVLIFRKVRLRPAKSIDVEQSSAAQIRRRSTNPIDGMSCPVAATGDFASPTGFVNYDTHRESEPPFKSNIDVRREEPVFSGKRNWKDDDETRKPRSLGKRIVIGAAWVAACSYAIGVVADFFKTGGVDGLGLQGF